ncbi:MAG: putative Co/Zn/Cd efflux system rane fusion protein, partial [Labilithrix sp.]|nr:putative Co/Zn/Cd efflux system rane fusion protein [Labilithrix sp.]
MRWLLTILGILVTIGALVAIKGAQIGMLIGFGKQMEKDGPPPEAVATAVAEEQAWEGTLTAVGSVATAKGVALAADAAGVVTRISFESGATVKQGQVLVELDANVERAQLASALARKELATTTIGRTRALAGKGAISQAQLDADESALRTATTDVEGLQAQIAKKTIRAPFSGKLGIRSVNLGQYLQPGTAVAVLETIDAVHVDFSLPQQRLGDVTVGQPVRITVDGSGNAPVDGTIAAVDPTVDPTTRTIKLRADVANKTEGLRPGMFVQVAVIMPDKRKAVTVPATAVVHAPYGDSVFVVEERKADSPGAAKTPDGKPVKLARQQFVRVGGARGDFVALLDGVKPSQEVVNVRQYPKLESATVTVRTAYVGANADLVRGFITTPVERAIAAADGIDYIESQSVQGLSTINVRLKLNFSAANALADITARVNQVRADLPPEAEVPSINIEPSDAQIAAMYLSFGSTILEDNQVTDYLIRVIQPRLSAIEGVQRADILGGSAFAIRAWLKPDRMAALGVTPTQVRQALAANNYLAAVGQTKGALVQVNLSAATDLRSVGEFKQLVVKRQGDSLVRLSDVAEVVL